MADVATHGNVALTYPMGGYGGYGYNRGENLLELMSFNQLSNGQTDTQNAIRHLGVDSKFADIIALQNQNYTATSRQLSDNNLNFTSRLDSQSLANAMNFDTLRRDISDTKLETVKQGAETRELMLTEKLRSTENDNLFNRLQAASRTQGVTIRTGGGDSNVSRGDGNVANI